MSIELDPRRMSSAGPLLLGHRGARLYAPENSFTAFDRALAHGCHGFEFDVRRTTDGRAFICHDDNFCVFTVARHAYAKFVGRASVRATDDSEQLCCLEEVLKRYADRAFFDIELKEAGLEDFVVDALRQHPPRCGYVVSSFLPDVITAMHVRDASIPLGLICRVRRQLIHATTLPITHLMPRRNLATRKLIDELHAAGKQVFVWTVNHPHEMSQFAAWGADAVVSDDTELLCRTLNRH